VKPLVAVARLVRVHAALAGAALTLLGARLTGAALPGRDLLLMALAVAWATAGGNALNDVQDRRIDGVNRRDRPIPAGAIGAKAACGIGAGALLLALLCAAFVSAWCLAICCVNAALLLAYARHSKRFGLAKNLTVGYLVGSAVLFGARSPALVNLPLGTLALCALLATVAREILKDVEDLDGDRSCGARTLPIAAGIPASLSLARAFLALAVAVSLLPWILGAVNGTFVVLAGVGAAIFALAAIRATGAKAAQLTVMAGSLVEMAAFYFGMV
jgi:geranylgeranylglycerol-phosphate geranylgeranyltransferase